MTGPRRSNASPRKPSPTDASEIVEGVFVGGWNDAGSFVGARFCVLDDRPEELSRLPGTEHLPIYDPATGAPRVENLDRIVEMAHRARQNGTPVLLFCGHGARRGSLAGAWYLHRYGHLTLDQAFDRVAAVRPQIERPEEWMRGWKQLIEDAPRKGRTGGR
jgi:protein-tyrosine phosphatase